ncbi:hypothetical protein QYF61_023823 [Mycteria americana]|uniref:Core shell protein Gag P30 domain-containing protein n=1 Tax=Mycteria americana TaxID=33587 RepID=A0AAN7RRV1_MYCAM|nr:hypothetical protein QYF61_023789 [Mycteria americana]KAK4814591.1 hypothetical protein QYF61_023790 [Mycteria americana]KAK4814592.1 hypothetical protein QYF61_023791 [Mycteria americana]KAK4814624.1 hypothetical protein QYF61_023823 [Mycteria americana]
MRWDRADSLARFVLPHPTGRRGLSGLQRAPTCRLGTPSAPLLRSGVRQGDKETPSAFSERLCEVARKWTDLDPEDDSNSKLFNRLFIGQAAADIRKR